MTLTEQEQIERRDRRNRERRWQETKYQAWRELYYLGPEGWQAPVRPTEWGPEPTGQDLRRILVGLPVRPL